MTNKELGEFIASENLKSATVALVKSTEKIIGAGFDIVSSVFLGIPSYTLLKPFLDGLKDWKTRVELKQISEFLQCFADLNQNERSEFSYLIQVHEDDFTEKLFYYISQLNDKKKARICGKLGVLMARKIITPNHFLSIIQKIQVCTYDDLILLKHYIEIVNCYFHDEENPHLDFHRFTLPQRIRKDQISEADKARLISLGFLFEISSWNQIGKGKSIENYVEVMDAIRNNSSQFCLTVDSYYIYISALKDID